MAAEIKLALTTTADNTAAFKRALETIVQDQVQVGVPEEKATRKAGEKINNAALARIHNLGTKALAEERAAKKGMALEAYLRATGSPARNIPARPFMEPGITSAKDQIAERMKAVALAALRGDAAGVTRHLNAVGLLAQNAIRKRINDGIPPPLKPGTIAARKRKGFQGEKPLIRTGQLRNAITYVIVTLKKWRAK